MAIFNNALESVVRGTFPCRTKYQDRLSNGVFLQCGEQSEIQSSTEHKVVLRLRTGYSDHNSGEFARSKFLAELRNHGLCQIYLVLDLPRKPSQNFPDGQHFQSRRRYPQCWERLPTLGQSERQDPEFSCVTPQPPKCYRGFR
jgi:hypothetical protein